MSATLETLVLRAKVFQAIRNFFSEGGYLEVDTPVRLPHIIPELYITPHDSDGWFMQTSPELCMKRLLASGLPQIFQLCKCFRKNEQGERHLPELTMLEWYSTGTDYFSLMDDCQNLMASIAQTLGRDGLLVWGDKKIDISPPWERLTLVGAFERYAPVSLDAAMQGGEFEEILVEHVEPCLGLARPLILYDYPASMGSLARLSQKNPKVAERFELYIAGVELANGFSELVDPGEQRLRFEQERELIKRSGRDPGPMPEKFLDDLQMMPDAAGIALGVDRLVMLFANCQDIAEVVAFAPEDL